MNVIVVLCGQFYWLSHAGALGAGYIAVVLSSYYIKPYFLEELYRPAGGAAKTIRS
jgi:hypothetical protein